MENMEKTAIHLPGFVLRKVRVLVLQKGVTWTRKWQDGGVFEYMLKFYSSTAGTKYMLLKS